MARPGRRRALAALVALAVIAACSEKTERAGTTQAGKPLDMLEKWADDCRAATVLACAPDGSTIADLLPATATEATGEPIRIGMINTETGPGTAFPELTLATRAGIDWMNAELGGVDGRPIELLPCDTKSSPTGSQQCAQQLVQKHVVAVAGGFDVFGDGIPILEDNGIPYVGGIPVSFASAKNPISFQFSGGGWGALLGFAEYATRDLRARRVAIAYIDFGPLSNAAELAARALRGLGAEDVHMVPVPAGNVDWLAPMTTANEGDPDAMFFLIADSACVSVFEASLELRVQARVFVTGGCAAPRIMDAAGDAALRGKLFNTETNGATPREEADLQLYTQVIEGYGGGLDPQTAGLIAFKGLVNLYVQMRALGAEGTTTQAIVERFRAARDEPGFAGHSYTCDGEQIPTLPALCSPQQVIAEYQDGNLMPVGDWIDVAALVGP